MVNSFLDIFELMSSQREDEKFYLAPESKNQNRLISSQKKKKKETVRSHFNFL